MLVAKCGKIMVLSVGYFGSEADQCYSSVSCGVTLSGMLLRCYIWH